MKQRVVGLKWATSPEPLHQSAVRRAGTLHSRGLQRAQTLCRCFPFLAPLLLPTPHQSLPNPTDSRPAGGGGGDGAAAGAPEIGRDLSRSQGQTPTSSLSPYPPLSRLDLLVVAPVKWRGWRIWDVGAGEGRHQLRISLRDIMVSNSENREKRSR
jgi:hypothetical protein